MLPLFRKVIIELIAKVMNPQVETISKQLSKIALYNLKGIDALEPSFKAKIEALIARMAVLGKPVYVSEGFRTAKRQDELYAQGRTTKGNVVTNARGLESIHQYTVAADLIFVGYDWNPPNDEWWNILGKEGQKLGLTWGGSWSDFPDRPHFEQSIDYQTLKTYFK